ncbi:uncharacterized protein LOC132732798 [Ruditapes philippinarum]|uniref:uncharacterized protein LOC132732798 n=1 Tax=Ruditapes philippinarum TaxID=129788 RepID=UPI00295C1C1D|nr:uncharacterized protein LOC132732798 [Ruditapes philippinarum]
MTLPKAAWIVFLLYSLSFCQFCYGKSKRKSLNVLTFNTWLHESLVEAYVGKDARKDRIIKGLKSSKADVICLQEAFIGQDVEDIVNGVKKEYPHSFSELHDDVSNLPPQATENTQPPCDDTRLNAYTTCIATNGCNTNDTKQNAGCLLANCLTPAFALFQLDSQDCINCLSMSLLNIEACSDKESVLGGRQMNNGGLLLLSKKKLRKVSYTDLYPSTKESISRGYLTAEIKDFAPVVCAHLSPATSDVFFEPDLLNAGFTSYSEMNTFEVKALVKRFAAIKPVILLGDMNTGPAFKSKQTARLPNNYKRLQKQFKTRPVKEYTFKHPIDASNQSILDHIFVKNLSILKTKRAFVPKKGETPMSDHVGVMSTLKQQK